MGNPLLRADSPLSWLDPVKDPTIDQIFDSIFEIMRSDLRSLTKPEFGPVAKARGLSTLRVTYRMLISQGHDEYVGLLRNLEAGLNGIHADCLKLLAAKLDELEGEDREEALEFLGR
jgi:hypothetical protein